MAVHLFYVWDLRALVQCHLQSTQPYLFLSDGEAYGGILWHLLTVASSAFFAPPPLVKARFSPPKVKDPGPEEHSLLVGGDVPLVSTLSPPRIMCHRQPLATIHCGYSNFSIHSWQDGLSRPSCIDKIDYIHFNTQFTARVDTYISTYSDYIPRLCQLYLFKHFPTSRMITSIHNVNTYKSYKCFGHSVALTDFQQLVSYDMSYWLHLTLGL